MLDKVGKIHRKITRTQEFLHKQSLSKRPVQWYKHALVKFLGEFLQSYLEEAF